MKPMSIFYYFINNIKKILPVSLSVSLGVMFFYFLFLAGKQANNLNYAAHVRLYEYFSIIAQNGDEIPSDYLGKIMNNQSINSIIPYDSFPHTAMTAALGNNSAGILFLRKQDITVLMDKMNLRITEGRMPDTEQEMLLHWRIAANKKLKPGDYFENQNEVQDRYKIIGIFDGSSVIAFVPKEIAGNNAADWADKNLILLPSEGDIGQMNRYLEALPSKQNVKVYTLEAGLEEQKNSNRIMYRVMLLLVSIIVVVLCITLSNTSIMHFYQRKNEFSLLSIIGYTKWEIIRRIWLEEIFTYSSCFFIGILLSMLCAKLLNILVWNPMGEYVSYWNAKGFMVTAIIPLAVIFASVIPIIRLLVKKDMIQIIDGK